MNTKNAKVETYRLVASNGRHIRMATVVRFADGHEVKFLDRLPKGYAIKQAEYRLSKELA